MLNTHEIDALETIYLNYINGNHSTNCSLIENYGLYSFIPDLTDYLTEHRTYVKTNNIDRIIVDILTKYYYITLR